MKKSKGKLLMVLLAVVFYTVILTGCGAQPKAPIEENEVLPDESTTEFQADENITIEILELRSEVTFIDVQSGETSMQLLARKGEDGAPYFAWNTCQVCNGSPYAYFELEDGVLVCQNCGNRFSQDSVGGNSGGCYPWPAEGIVLSGNAIMIPAETLEDMVPHFANWKQGL